MKSPLPASTAPCQPRYSFSCFSSKRKTILTGAIYETLSTQQLCNSQAMRVDMVYFINLHNISLRRENWDSAVSCHAQVTQFMKWQNYEPGPTGSPWYAQGCWYPWDTAPFLSPTHPFTLLLWGQDGSQCHPNFFMPVEVPARTFLLLPPKMWWKAIFV